MTIIWHLLLLPLFLIALTVHEYAHAITAQYFGDSTAKENGRLTLNPLSHLNFMGTLVFFVSLIVFKIPFGWARPLPLTPTLMNNSKKNMILVALAGPSTNLAIAGIIFTVSYAANAIFMLPYEIHFLLQGSIKINLGLGLFNLLPLYPLDGYSIITGILPERIIQRYFHISRSISLVILTAILIKHMQNIF